MNDFIRKNKKKKVQLAIWIFYLRIEGVPAVCFVKSDSEFAGELRVRDAHRRPGEPPIKGCVQHLLQCPDSHKVQAVSNVSRKLLQVLVIAFGEDDTFHPCPVSGQDLVLDPANLRRRRRRRKPLLTPQSEYLHNYTCK